MVFGPLPSKFGCRHTALVLQNRITLSPVAPDQGRGIAAEHQVYTIELKDNALVTNGLTVNATSTLTPDSGTPFDLIVPATVDFDTAGAVAEGTYDVEITIPGTDRPQASGVYSDTITFTIMDDN